MTSTLLWTFCGALLLTGASLPVLRRAQLVDVPNHRSSHVSPVPRGGGLPVMLVLLVVVALHQPAPEAVVVSAVALALALVGLADDASTLSSRARLLAQVTAGIVLLATLSAVLDPRPGWVLLVLLGPVGFVAYVNAFNFMDGINAISALSAVVAGGWYAWLGHTQEIASIGLLGAGLVGCGLGFLPWNLAGKVFLGDVGSYGIGAVVAGCAVTAWVQGVPGAVAIAPLLVYLADTGWVILTARRRGVRLGQAHRDHVYQRLVHQLGWSHLRSSAWVVLVTTVCCLAVGRGWSAPWPVPVTVALVAVGLLTYLVSPRLRFLGGASVVTR